MAEVHYSIICFGVTSRNIVNAALSVGSIPVKVALRMVGHD